MRWKGGGGGEEKKGGGGREWGVEDKVGGKKFQRSSPLLGIQEAKYEIMIPARMFAKDG